MKHTIINLIILSGILLPAITVSLSAAVDAGNEATAGNHLMLRHHDAKDTLLLAMNSETKGDSQTHTDNQSLTTTLPIRLNAGGSAFVDDEGNQWEPDDAYVNTGRKWKTNETILATIYQPTPIQDLYQTERWDKLGGKRLKYIFDELPNGNYLVHFHFSENYVNAEGERVFHIWMQGVKDWVNVDIFKLAGGKFKPLVLRHYNARVTDGTLVVTFQHVTQNPKVNGIEIVPMNENLPQACTERRIDFAQPALKQIQLKGGDYVSLEWEKFGMLLSSSGGYDTRPRLFNTSDIAESQDANLGTPNERCSDSGPGIGEGGEPDMPGENCQEQGNVLIVQDPNGNVKIPNANENGGKILFEFPELARINEIGLLDIDYETSISLVVKNKGVGFRRLPPIELPVLGDNSFQVVKIDKERVKRVEVNFSSSGAVTHISFCGNKPLSPRDQHDQCILDCPSHYCSHSEDEGYFCVSCNPLTNEGCDAEREICESKFGTDSSGFDQSCYLLGGESCSRSIDCSSDVCDTETKNCWNCTLTGYDHEYGKKIYNVGCHGSEVCVLVGGTYYDCLTGSRYAVVRKYIGGEEFYRLSTSKAESMFNDCQNADNVILANIANAPLLICPGKSFMQDKDGYFYELNEGENVTVNCSANVREIHNNRCLVEYRKVLLGIGENCTRDDQCQSDLCRSGVCKD